MMQNTKPKPETKSPPVAGLSYPEMLSRALEEVPKDIQTPISVEIPQFEVQKETVRTIITNWNDVVGKYKIYEKLLLRFLQKRLGTIGMVQHGKLYLQGSFTRVRLNKLLEAFMKEYVICDVCGRPHCTIIREKGKLIKKCLACGAWRAVEKP